jgi:hypothetical protein
MPLHAVDPPIAAYEAMRSVLSDLASHAAFRTPALRRADPASLALSTPHRFAVLPLNQIRRQTGLRTAAEMKGWRFLVHDGQRVVATVDAIETDKGEHQFGQLNEGPLTAGTEDAIRRAERLDAVRKGHYEPAFLLVPALYVAALWLQDRDGDSDLVLPMAPAPQELKPYEPMSAGAFLEVLVRLAARVPTDEKKGKEPSGG